MKKLIVVLLLVVILLVAGCNTKIETFNGKVIGITYNACRGSSLSTVVYFDNGTTVELQGRLELVIGTTYEMTVEPYRTLYSSHCHRIVGLVEQNTY